MVQRQRVTDDAGRRWVTGALDPDTYFAQRRREARETARRLVAQRLAALRHDRHALAGR